MGGLMLQLTVLSAEIPKRGSMELKADTVLQILLPILTEEVHSENSDHGETEVLQLLMLVSERTMLRFSVTKTPSMVLDILSSQLFMKSNFTSISDLKLQLMEQLTPIATELLTLLLPLLLLILMPLNTTPPTPMHSLLMLLNTLPTLEKFWSEVLLILVSQTLRVVITSLSLSNALFQA